MLLQTLQIWKFPFKGKNLVSPIVGNFDFDVCTIFIHSIFIHSNTLDCLYFFKWNFKCRDFANNGALSLVFKYFFHHIIDVSLIN